MRARPPIDWRNKYTWQKFRSNPHRHQRMVSRVIRGLREHLHLTLAQLGQQIGVSAVTVSRWSQPNGAYPHPDFWRRIKELWWLVRFSKTEVFTRDRVDPPDFSI